MSTIQTAYAAKAAIAVTALASLANGSAMQSAAVDNTTTKYLDARIRIQTNGTASGVSLLDVYVYTALGDTTYTDGATGSDAAFTAANRKNARYLGSIQMNAATAVVGELPSVAQAFGGVMPDKWGLIMVNNSGQAMAASGHTVEYEGLTATAA